MADYLSTELTPGYNRRPQNDHGKERLQYFSFTATAAIPIGSTIDLCDLPAGTVRLIPHLSRLSVGIIGATATIDIGHRAYFRRPFQHQTEKIAEDGKAFIDAMSAAAAIQAAPWSNALKHDLFSQNGIRLFMTNNLVAIPINTEIDGFVKYVHE